ncbi:ScyD/ScyE family protein [Actinacidiphila rubida]|uniref:ScyD/ScyE family protein n=1 Tax=Actinacidiphila rubida TaxID=310780 RepID=A0A1H8LL50_9ACTN|nr:ScyD/ScyE family protein [Actinacidiphila rubida]SEO05743.1 hypothetical protein SAMN05216267_101668 [Actinacidiphila rubida]
MRRLTTSRVLLSAVATATALVGLGVGPSGAAAASAAGRPGELTADAPVTVIASGLSEPKDMIWGPGGHLLVAEAGTPPALCQGSGFSTVCYGETGSITDLSSGTPVHVVDHLASVFDEEEVVGPDAMAYTGGHLYTLETASPEQVPDGLPADLTARLKQRFGALLDVTGGHVSVVADPGTYDWAWTVEHKDLEPNDYPSANPYAFKPRPGGGFYVVDASANTLDSVDAHGNVRVLSFIPDTPAGTDAVPSCLDVGPDGSVYVGEITGYGNDNTAAKVYRYAPHTGRLSVWQSGFSAISGCGFGANGDFYVTELDTTGFLPPGDPIGAVVQIGRDGTRTVLGQGKLFAPTGFLAGRDGSVYVANKAIMWPACTDAPACTTSSTVSATGGEVVRIG